MIGMEYQKPEGGKTNVYFPKEFFRGEFRCDFFVSSMMKRVWAAQIEVLAEIDRVCRKYDIQYFADSGTLLGAVRHKGFIPWDDDMDIAMKRKDYNRFMEICEKELDQKYELYVPFVKKGYKQPFARVVNGIGISESDSLEWCHDCNVIAGIDIFPFDYLSKNEAEAALQTELGSLIYTVTAQMSDSEKKDDAHTQEAVRQAIRRIEEVCELQFDHSKDILIQLGAVFDGICQLYTDEEADELCCIPFLEDGVRYAKEYYDEVVLLEFETVKLPCPAGYHEILEAIYGNYNEFVINAAAHDYPYYKKLLKDREKEFCDNLCEMVRESVSQIFCIFPNEIHNMQMLKYSFRNCTIKYELSSDEYAIRVVNSGHGELLNRQTEAAIYELLKPYQITEECIWLQSGDGSKISKYIKDSHPCDTADWEEVAACMEVVSYVHHLKADLDCSFDLLERIESFENMWGDASYYPDYRETKTKILELYNFTKGQEKAWGLTHFDLAADNFLITEKDGLTDIHIIDWEYAGMQDTHIDLAMFALKADYSREELDKLLDLYFEDDYSVVIKKKIYAYMSICALFLSNYYEYYDRKGVEMWGEPLRYYPLAKEYYRFFKDLA